MRDWSIDLGPLRVMVVRYTEPMGFTISREISGEGVELWVGFGRTDVILLWKCNPQRPRGVTHVYPKPRNPEPSCRTG